MDLIRQNWSWIACNPWGFLACALLFVGIGWTAAKVIYGAHMDLLKSQLAEAKTAALTGNAVTKFEYPSNGRHGRNLLANSVHQVDVKETLSLQARVPNGSKLHLAFRWVAADPTDTEGAWYMEVSTCQNWVHTGYRREPGKAEQEYDALEGFADWRIRFERPGALTIQGFEGDDQKASWTKTVLVRAKAS